MCQHALHCNLRCILNLDSLPELANHVSDGIVSFAGAGDVCIAIEASSQLTEDKELNV